MTDTEIIDHLMKLHASNVKLVDHLITGYISLVQENRILRDNQKDHPCNT